MVLITETSLSGKALPTSGSASTETSIGKFFHIKYDPFNTCGISGLSPFHHGWLTRPQGPKLN